MVPSKPLVLSFIIPILSREVKKGLKENVLAGKITGGKPPFGFSVDREKKFIINEQEAVAIRHIFSQSFS